ncbi:serine hydrolase domain-containing protein [Zhouia sp. PK063]|uniref:serine hydrolase domain-containing protein n=1 Tax=Zhouia sp. PK063 TaxID=3373602 RepID=UPI00378800B9
MHNILLKTFLTAFFTTMVSYAQHQTATIDSLLSSNYPDNAPGAVFLVAKDGNVIYKKAFGLSNLELRTKMTTKQVFEIGSLTKQFTAAMVLLLEERHLLKTTDPIAKYINNYPNGHQITIHELLTHTSGIKDYTSIPGINAMATLEKDPLEIINFFKNEPLKANPGQAFEYANSNYFLLGYIIEKVTGKSYKDVIEENIFHRLHMTHSYYDSHTKVIANRAYGYQKKRDQYVNARYISFSIPFAAGSLMTTVNDMLLWEEALKNNTLLSTKSKAKMFTNYVLTNGKPIHYGYGWHIDTYKNHTVLSHGGAIFGFKAMEVFLPEKKVYVIGLTNCDCNSPTQITRQIAELF